MAYKETSKELPLPLRRESDSLFLLNGPEENFELTSETSTENGSNKSDSPSEAEPVRKAGKRGRPRLLRDDRREADLKERRRGQLRIAQRAYRCRKEDQITTLTKKVTELEQKLFLMRNLYLNTCASSMNPETLIDCSPQDSLERPTANNPTGIHQAPTAAFGAHSTESVASIPVCESFPPFEMNYPLSPDMSPIAPPHLDMSHAFFNDGINYAGCTPAWRRYNGYSNDIQNSTQYLPTGIPM